MTTWDTGSGGSGVLRLTMSENSWDVASNTSSVYIKAEIYTPSGSYHLNADLSISLSGDVGWNHSTWSFNSSGGWKTVYEANVSRGHNADGTGSITVSFSLDEYSGTSGLGGPTTNGPRTLGLTTIPRASTASFSPSATFDAGAAVTINTNWASSSFTHDISYYFGSTSGMVATGVGGATTWTPPLSLLAQIPNATSGNGYIDVATYNGGTYIGHKTTAFTLKAPATAVPSISSLTLTDTDTTVVNAVGAYVQTLTDLKCVVNAAGYQGSTITSSTFAISGQSVASGGSITLPTSGTVAVVATTTDSRGRTNTYSQNISVLPYSLPAFTSYQVRRCTVAGVLDDNGTYLRVDLIAASRSIINGTEKNTLTINTFSRARGTTPWTARNVIAHTSVSYNNNYIVSGGAAFPINTSFEVKVEIVDKFNTSGAQTTISTATVLMNLSKTGVGIGKYHEQGVLDVSGQIYQNSGLAVLDTSDVVVATQAEAIAGTNNTKFITPLTLMGSVTGRGTTAQRDAYFGVPATDAARAALANAVPDWFNTSTGYLESYYALSTISGVNSMRKAVATGWYPIAGNIPICSMLRANTVVQCGSGIFTAIPLDSEVINVHGMWSSGTPTRINISIAGQYLITAGGGVSGSGGGRVGNRIKLSGTDIGGTLVGGQADDVSPKTSIVWQCWAGSYVEFDIFQESGGTKNSSGAQYARPSITVTYLSPPLVK